MVAVHLLTSFEGKRFDLKKLFNPYAIMAALFIPLAFILLNPYHFIYWDKTLAILKGVSQKYGMGTKSLTLYPLSFLYHRDYGPIEFFLVLLGI